MIYGIGTDIVRVARMQQSIDKHGERFARRILTDHELIGYQQTTKPAHYLAKRFAAKEAVFKATGKGLRDGMAWKDIEVVNNEQGKPIIHLHNETARLLAGKSVHLSLSHAGNMAIAMVVVDTLFENAGE